MNEKEGRRHHFIAKVEATETKTKEIEGDTLNPDMSFKLQGGVAGSEMPLNQ